MKSSTKNLMSQANVLKSFRWIVSWDFDLCEKIHYELLFLSKLTAQITTFFGYTM